MGKRELVALLLLCRCYCSLTFPRRVVGLYYVNVAFVIFPTFISWSYSLTFLNNRVYDLFLDGWPIAHFGRNVKIVSGYPAQLHLVLRMVLL